VTSAVVLPPLQRIAPAETLALSAAGCGILTVTDAKQPFTSVTTYELDPAEAVKLPVPVMGAVPPLELTTTVVVPPKQEMLPVVAEAVILQLAAFTTSQALKVQPLASVMVMQ
jgi:hypothetical protein